MTGRFIRPVAAIASVLIIAAAGVAWQPAGQPAAQPGGQPAGQPAGQPGEQRGPRAPGERGGGPQQPASVEGSMKGMNRAMRQLSQNIGDAAKRDENLRIINDLQRACINAKGAALPEGFFKNAKDDAAKSKITDEYRHELIRALRVMLDIEADIASGKTDDAKAKLEELGKIRDHGHEEMGKKHE